MEIVRAFQNNELSIHVTIQGTHEEPLFRASDIGAILEINTIRSSVRDFDDTEKVVHKAHTLGGEQEVLFLTEKGLYKVLFRSRKSIAEKFTNWVCEVIKEIRLNSNYELKKQLENKQLEVENITITNDNYLMIIISIGLPPSSFIILVNSTSNL